MSLFTNILMYEPPKPPDPDAKRARLLKKNSRIDTAIGALLIGFGIFWLLELNSAGPLRDGIFTTVVVLILLVLLAYKFSLANFDLRAKEGRERNRELTFKAQAYAILDTSLIVILLLGISLPSNVLIGALWILLGVSRLIAGRNFGR